MTEGQKKYLLHLYATHTLEDIDENFDAEIAKKMGKEKYELLKSESDFNDYSLLLKCCNAQVTRILINDDHKMQLCDTIDDLYNKRNVERINEDKFNTCVEFYKTALYEKWDEKCKAYFDTAEKKLLRRRQVFISYTNRDASLNNNIYKNLIETLPAPIKENVENRDKNLVAWVVCQHLLINNQVTGYFDQEKADYEFGRKLPCLLKENCEDSFTFLQLLEKRIFDKADEQTRNYCFDEYVYFSSGYNPVWEKTKMPADTLFFMFRLSKKEEDFNRVFPTNFPPAFAGWRQDVKDVLNLKLHADILIGDFMAQIDALANVIQNRAKEVLEKFKEEIKAA